MVGWSVFGPVGWWPGPIYGGGFYRPFCRLRMYRSWAGAGRMGFGVGFGGWGGFGWFPSGRATAYHGGRIPRPFRGCRFRGNFGDTVASDRCMVATATECGRIHDNHIGRSVSTARRNRFGTTRPSGRGHQGAT